MTDVLIWIKPDKYIFKVGTMKADEWEEVYLEAYFFKKYHVRKGPPLDVREGLVSRGLPGREKRSEWRKRNWELSL